MAIRRNLSYSAKLNMAYGWEAGCCIAKVWFLNLAKYRATKTSAWAEQNAGWAHVSEERKIYWDCIDQKTHGSVCLHKNPVPTQPQPQNHVFKHILNDLHWTSWRKSTLEFVCLWTSYQSCTLVDFYGKVQATSRDAKASGVVIPD